MRILFWSDGFWPRLGGIETQSLVFIQEMMKRGYQFQVVAQKDHPSWKEAEDREGIEIHRFDFNSLIHSKELKGIRSIQEELDRIVQTFKPNLIHLNTLIGGSIFAFHLFKNRFHLPTLLTAYAPYLHQGSLPLMIQKTLDSVDLISPISDWVSNVMNHHRSEASHKLRRIYCGLPEPKKMERSPPLFPPTLLTFGRLSWEKGFDTVIDALALLKKRGSDAKLVIGGGGSEKERLEKQASDLGIRDAVQFTGVLNGEEMEVRFNEASIVIVPSIHESFGLVVLEAMQRGRPVIASRVEGIPEVVIEGETALLVPPQDPESLSCAIETLLNDRERAQKMGLKGKERATHFTLEQNVDQYEALYKELV